MKIKIVITAVLITQLLFYPGIAQDLKFTLVTNPNGKPLGKINAISQDPHGYIWLVNSGEKSIYRYDGNRMISFRHDDSNPNSLSLGNLETLYIDDSGMVWIGGTGLDKYDPSTGIFKNFHNLPNDTNSISSNAIYSILKDKQGRLWVGTDKGLDRLDEKTGKFIHYKNQAGNNKSISSNVIWRLYEDRQGVIWVATGWPWFKINPEDGGLNRLENDGSFTRFMHDPKDPHSLINNKIAAVFEDSRGTFWVGTSGDGLHTMDRNTGRFQRLLYNPDNPEQLSRPAIKKGEVNDKITFITEDSTGSIWIGTRSSGINRYDPGTKKITHFEHSNGFPDSTSWNICVSKEGVVWITTENANLYRFDPFEKPINSVQIGTTAMNFLEDVDGYLWVGTLGKGLYKFNQQNQIIRQFKYNPSMPNGMTHNNIMGLFQKNRETLWVGSHGLRMLNTVTNEFSRTDVTAINDTLGLSFICTSKQGIYWFGTWGGGLTRYNPKDNSYRTFLHDELDSTTINSNEVLYILEDKLGLLWIATSQGINLLDPEKGTFKLYLKGFWTSSFYEDSRGNLWAGSLNGLYQYNRNEDRFTHFFDEQSVMSTFTTGGITEDESKNLWFLNQKGIVKLNPLTKEIFIYGSKYGINPQELTTWAKVYKNKKGQIFMPHSAGYYTFSPEELNSNQKLNIIITELFINSLPVLTGKQDFLKNPIEETNELLLNYNQNNLAFNFTSIDYREPEFTRYYTMLENYDNTWREVKGEKYSYYINIQPGKYLFHIKAYTTDGVSAEKILTIQVQPPWWKTWWAYSLYGLLLISALVITVRIQKQRIIQRERQKAQVVELAQAKEIEKAYHELRSTQSMLIQSEKMASLGELTAGIAHEIQNPLNFVNNFSEVSNELITEMSDELDKGDIDEAKAIAKDIKQNLEKINHHGKRADAIVKGMLQHSRTSTGQKEPTDINAQADEYLRISYHGLRTKDKSFNAIIQTDLDPGIGKINLITQDIGRVLLNLYNNAFYAVSEKKKLAGAGYEPAITVSTRKLGNKIEIIVADNGIGIPPQVRDKIFQPFFTTKPTGQGTGLGLSLSYDIVKAHGGEIVVESCPESDGRDGGGTTFTIELPV